MSLARWEKWLPGLAAACVLGAVVTRPLAAALWPAYQVWSVCPLEEDDLLLVPGSGRIDKRVLETTLDSWGQPLHVRTLPGAGGSVARIYSAGRDGVDEDGDGDDVTLCFESGFFVIAWTPIW